MEIEFGVFRRDEGRRGGIMLYCVIQIGREIDRGIDVDFDFE